MSKTSLTMTPAITDIDRPQCVLGTMSPYPILRKVTAISHIVLSILSYSGFCCLNINEEMEQAKFDEIFGYMKHIVEIIVF